MLPLTSTNATSWLVVAGVAVAVVYGILQLRLAWKQQEENNHQQDYHQDGQEGYHYHLQEKEKHAKANPKYATGATAATADKIRPHPNQFIDNNNSDSSNNSSYAYAFVVGGCDPRQPYPYRGFLYNILVAAHLLRNTNSNELLFGGASRADIVALFQMNNNIVVGKDNDSRGDNMQQQQLRPEEVEWLTALGVHIYYIPTTPSSSSSLLTSGNDNSSSSNTYNFYEMMLEKFRILQLVQYRRVLFLDADVIPLANLDYLFHLSDDPPNNHPQQNDYNRLPRLYENVLVAGGQEPCSGGFFLLTPGVGEYEHLQQIIRQRELAAQHLETENKFDTKRGWGHAIDAWETRKHKVARDWTFYGADSDQGLLYMWTKYVKQHVSIIVGQELQQWGKSSNNNNEDPILQERIQRPFRNLTLPVPKFASGSAPYRHFHHFTGRTKPWQQRQPLKSASSTQTLSLAAPSTPQEYWLAALLQVNERLHLFDSWEQEHARLAAAKPPLGRVNRKEDIAQRVERANIRQQQQQGRKYL